MVCGRSVGLVCRVCGWLDGQKWGLKIVKNGPRVWAFCKIEFPGIQKPVQFFGQKMGFFKKCGNRGVGVIWLVREAVVGFVGSWSLCGLVVLLVGVVRGFALGLLMMRGGLVWVVWAVLVLFVIVWWWWLCCDCCVVLLMLVAVGVCCVLLCVVFILVVGGGWVGCSWLFASCLVLLVRAFCCIVLGVWCGRCLVFWRLVVRVWLLDCLVVVG